VIAFAAVLVAACFLMVGAIPALLVARPDLAGMMKDASRTATSGRGRALLRRALVTTEIALMAMLLGGASLLIRSFNRILATDPGFRPEQLVTLDLFLPSNKYAPGADWAGFGNRLLERINTIGGVSAAALTTNLPPGGRNMSAPMEAEGRARALVNAAERPICARHAGLSRHHADRMKRGRWFDSRDVAGAQPVAVISESLAREMFPNQDPLASEHEHSSAAACVKSLAWSAMCTKRPSRVPGFGVSIRRSRRSRYLSFMCWATERAPDAVTADLTAALRQIDPEQPISSTASMKQR
jgi:putative ABC transport system permease protein